MKKLILILLLISFGLALYKWRYLPTVTTVPQADGSDAGESGTPRTPSQVLAGLRGALLEDDAPAANRREEELKALGSAALPLIAEALQKNEPLEEDVVLQQRLCFVLGEMLGPEAQKILAAVLANNQDDEVRGQALLGLSAFNNSDAIKAMEATLADEDESPKLRDSAALLLARRVDAVSFEALTRTYRLTPAAYAKQSILEALGFSPNPEARRFVIQALKDLKLEPLRAAALVALVRLEHGKLAPDTAALLANERMAGARREAILALGEFAESPAVRETLARFLSTDHDKGVRALSAAKLAVRGAVEVVPPLEAALMKDPDLYVQLKCVESIGLVSGKASEEALERIKTAKLSERVRRQATLELQKAKAPPEKPAEETESDTETKKDF